MEVEVSLDVVEVVDPNGEGTAEAVRVTAVIPPGRALDALARWWARVGDVLRQAGHRS